MTRAAAIATIVICSAAGVCPSAADVPEAVATDAPTLQEQFQRAYASSKSLADKGRYAEAVPFAKTALELGEKVFGEADASTAKLTLNYGTLLEAAHRPIEAVSILDSAVKRFERLYGESATELIEPLMTRASAWAWSDPISARYDFDRAIKIARDEAPEDHLLEAQLNDRAGDALLAARAAEAGPYLEKNYRLVQTQLGDLDERTGDAAGDLARYEDGMHRTREAIRLMNLAIGTWSGAKTPDAARLERGHAYMVDLCERVGDHESAITHAQAIGALRAADASSGARDAVPLFRVNPNYPRSAQMNGEEGWVQIEFTIDANGAVKDPKVIDHEGDAFIQTALAAFRRWRYAPKYVDGQPVDSPGRRVVLRFNLED